MNADNNKISTRLSKSEAILWRASKKAAEGVPSPWSLQKRVSTVAISPPGELDDRNEFPPRRGII